MKYFLIVAILTLPVSVFSQDSISSVKFIGKKWQKGTISFSASIGGDHYYRGNYRYSSLIEDSKNTQNFYSFNKKDFYEETYQYSRPASVFQLSVSLHPFIKRRNSFSANHEIRIGLVYYGGSDFQTTLSNKYNNAYYNGTSTDTTYIGSITYTQQMDQLGAEIAYIFRSENFWKRFSLFGGVGAGFSYSVYSQTKETVETYIKNSYNNYYYGYYSNNYSAASNIETNTYDGALAYSIRAVIPYGVDFRIVNSVHTYIETRSGFLYQKISGGSGKFRIQNAIGLGVRFKF